MTELKQKFKNKSLIEILDELCEYKKTTKIIAISDEEALKLLEKALCSGFSNIKVQLFN